MTREGPGSEKETDRGSVRKVRKRKVRAKPTGTGTPIERWEKEGGARHYRYERAAADPQGDISLPGDGDVLQTELELDSVKKPRPRHWSIFGRDPEEEVEWRDWFFKYYLKPWYWVGMLALDIMVIALLKGAVPYNQFLRLLVPVLFILLFFEYDLYRTLWPRKGRTSMVKMLIGRLKGRTAK